jgi:hypothetical protein
MESVWQFLLDVSANHVTRNGLYIPGEPYRPVLWNDLLVLVLSFALVIMFLKLNNSFSFSSVRILNARPTQCSL